MNEKTSPFQIARKVRSKICSGFTLIEVLVVVVVISILIALVGPIFSGMTSSQSPRVVATVIASQLERARGYAVAKNTFVWIRLGEITEVPNALHLAVFESLDGTDDVTSAAGAWSAPRFDNFALSSAIDPGFSRPAVPASDKPSESTWIRFSPDGEAWIIPGDVAQARNAIQPPAVQPTIIRTVELGIQPTRRGLVPSTLEADVAAIHLHGINGQAVRYIP